MFLSLLHRPIFSLLRFSSQFFRRFTSLIFSRTFSMADFQLLDDLDSDDIPHAFLCCVCLDLLYKPIVLSCGHISCFWCVHKSMNGFRESHCPICRRPYYHFPTICEMLHLLILKNYPVACKKRANQMLEEETKIGLFSPQFDALACGSQAGKKVEHLEDSANGELNTNTKNDNVVAELILKENSEVVRSASVESLNSLQDLCGQKTQNQEKMSVADVLCQACTQLLFRPVVLNCGHAFCESCINSKGETLECQVCQFLQPRGFPNVCLELDQFLKEQFPEEYSLRRDSVQLKLANTFKHESPTSCSNEESKNKKGEDLPRWGEVASKVHSAVGCDSCGIDSFRSRLEAWWIQNPSQGRPGHGLMMKLKALKQELRSWNLNLSNNTLQLPSLLSQLKEMDNSEDLGVLSNEQLVLRRLIRCQIEDITAPEHV